LPLRDDSIEPHEAELPPLPERVRRILGLALPIIGAMVSQNLLNLVDTAMVGQLGSPALGAVGFGGMVHWLAGALFFGLGSGVQAIAARRVGEGDRPGAISALQAALSLAACVALPYALLLSTWTEEIFRLLSDDPEVISAGGPYLRVRFFALAFVVMNFSFRGYWNGIGRSTVYLRTIVMIHATNIFLNWVLIYGHLGVTPMGVTGAGLASAIAVTLGSATYFVLTWRHARQTSGERGALPLRNVARLSIPAGLQNLFYSAGFVLFFWVAQRLGTRELAATNVLINLSLVAILPALGFGLAAATLVGQALGARRSREAMRWGWNTVWIAAVAMALLGGLLAGFPRIWLDLLINDPAAEAMAVAPLVLLGLMQPVESVGIVLSQTLIGAGAVRSVMVVSVVMQWGLFLPGGYLVSVRLGGGLIALWIALVVWRALLSLVMALLFSRGRWLQITV
jgi:putative MATE family efflux protein